MIDITTIEEGLVTWIDTILSAKAVPLEDPISFRPDLPYVCYRLNVIDPIGEDENILPIDSDGLGKIKGNRDIPTFFQYYGDNPMGNLEVLYSSLSNYEILNTLESIGLGYVDVVSPITSTNLRLDNCYEQRAVMTLRFRTISVTENVNMGAIEAVEYDYESVNPSRIEDNILIDAR